MALIVEDGTMPDGANSYASVEEADEYLPIRGVAWPIASSDVGPELGKKEAALLRASEWLNALDWKGEQIDPLWPMAWPRSGVPLSKRNWEGVMQFLPSDTIPLQVKRACMELAGMIYTGTDPFTSQPRGGAVKSVSESSATQIDVIQESTSKSITYADNAPSETFYPLIMGMIGVFLISVPGKTSCVSMRRVIKA